MKCTPAMYEASHTAYAYDPKVESEWIKVVRRRNFLEGELCDMPNDETAYVKVVIYAQKEIKLLHEYGIKVNLIPPPLEGVEDLYAAMVVMES